MSDIKEIYRKLRFDDLGESWVSLVNADTGSVPVFLTAAHKAFAAVFEKVELRGCTVKYDYEFLAGLNKLLGKLAVTPILDLLPSDMSIYDSNDARSYSTQLRLDELRFVDKEHGNDITVHCGNIAVLRNAGMRYAYALGRPSFVFKFEVASSSFAEAAGEPFIPSPGLNLLFTICVTNKNGVIEMLDKFIDVKASSKAQVQY